MSRKTNIFPRHVHAGKVTDNRRLSCSRAKEKQQESEGDDLNKKSNQRGKESSPRLVEKEAVMWKADQTTRAEGNLGTAATWIREDEMHQLLS